MKAWSRALKQETMTLFFAYRDSRTPWHAKVWAICVVAYAFSPIDLIPDFIPVLGVLDDLILLPLGIAVAIRLVPKEVMEESRASAAEWHGRARPTNRIAAGVIIGIWIAVAGISALWLVRLLHP